MTNTATSGKKRNRYFQVDCLTSRGYTLGRIFTKADNIAQVRAELAKATPIYQNHVTELYRYGHLSGNPRDGIATAFKVTCVCHLYAKACACGGYDLTKERTKAERRSISHELASLLSVNTTPLPQYYC